MAARPANYRDWQSSSRSVEAWGAYGVRTISASKADGTGQRLSALLIADDVLPVLSVAPLHGRLLDGSEVTGRASRALVRESVWRAFHVPAAANALGQLAARRRRARCRRHPARLVRAVPGRPRCRHPVSGVPHVRQDRAASRFRVIGRLADGVTLQQATAELETIAAGLARTYPATNAGQRVVVESLQRRFVGASARSRLFGLFWASLALLGAAFSNVAGFQLVEARSRMPETALRAALGATPLQSLQHGAGRTAVFALFAGVMACLCAVSFTTFLGNSLVVDRHRADVSQPPHVVTGIRVWGGCARRDCMAHVAARWRVIRAAAARPWLALHSSRHRRTRSVHSLLLVPQIALATYAVGHAAATTLRLASSETLSVGFDADGLVWTEVALPLAQRRTAADRRLGFARLIERVEAMPGVEAAAVSSFRPLRTPQVTRAVDVHGTPSGCRRHSPWFHRVSGTCSAAGCSKAGSSDRSHGRRQSGRGDQPQFARQLPRARHQVSASRARAATSGTRSWASSRTRPNRLRRGGRSAGRGAIGADAHKCLHPGIPVHAARHPGQD